MSFWNNKVAVITGAGGGIGRADALLFASRGARVVVSDVKEEGGRETAAMVGADKARFVRADVTREEGARRVFVEAESAFGGVDVLVNNAGIIERHPTIDEVPMESFRRVLESVLTSVFVMTKAALPYLRRRGGGVIVNMSSVGARGNPMCHAYGAGKAGILALTLGMVEQLRADRIRVNAVMPGLVETPMTIGGPIVEMAKKQGLALFTAEQMARAVATAAENQSLNGALLRYDQSSSGPKLERLRSELWGATEAWEEVTVL